MSSTPDNECASKEWTDQHGQNWRALTVEDVREYLALERGIWEGYCEARDGKAFDPFRYASEQIAQVRYEDGRKFCALVRLRQGDAPNWTIRWKPPEALISVCMAELRRGGASLL